MSDGEGFELTMELQVTPVVDAAEHVRMRRCLELFEDFCVDTQSVRNGIEVDVAVEPVAELAPSGDVRATSVTAV